MILTTLNPTTLIIGKVISLFAVGLLQMAIFLTPVALGYVFFRDRLSLPALDLAAMTFDLAQMIIGALLAWAASHSSPAPLSPSVRSCPQPGRPGPSSVRWCS
jgi:ABC-type Na+ efflux pump permease subunit